MLLSKKVLTFSLLALLLVVGGFFVYLNYAFPAVRCEAFNHLEAPEKYADCVSCHAKVTSRITQDWYESKHGTMLVKCVVCHGQPDGKGAIPFSAKPDARDICSRCHAPAMERMYAKFGPNLGCNTCHPYHQNTIHSNSYETKTPTTKTTF